MHVSFPEFQAGLENVGLHQALVSCAQVYERAGRTWPPTDLWSMTSLAAELLRYDPQLPLADSPLALESLPQNTLAQTLGKIVNASITPLDQRATGDSPSFSGSHISIDSCSSAERNFVTAFRALRFFRYLYRARSEPWTKNDVRVIVDGIKPVLVQKAAGKVASALSLRTIFIDGIPFPPGSIMAVQYNTGERNHLPSDCIETVGLDDLKEVAFMRLSYFALPPHERPQRQWDYRTTDSQKRNIHRLRIERIAQIAGKAAQIADRQGRSRQVRTAVV